MNYTLNQLRIFLKVAQTLNITRASKELHLSQPAVSIQLKNFQDQFKIPLFETINKRLYVTDFGYEIIEAAEKIIYEMDEIENKVHAHQGQLTGKLKLSVVSTGKYIAPYFLTDFIKQNPGIELLMDVTNKLQVLQSLESNKTDFALVSVLPEHLQIEKIELMHNKLFVVGGKDNTYKSKNYDWKILKEMPLIYREEGSGTRYVMESFIKRNKLTVTKKMELTSNEAVKQAVIAGLGYSIMPLIGIRNEIQNKQIQIIPVKGFPIQSVWTLIWLKKKKLSPVATAYLNHLKKEKQHIIDKAFHWYEKF